MVITPQQVKEKMNQREKVQLKQLEVQIDQNLMKGLTNIVVGSGLNLKLKDKIIHKYRDAGWEVQYISDQQQGDYLCFNESRQIRGFSEYGR